MQLDFQFFLTAFLLGIGLAMDAFSVSLANGLNEPCMRKSKMTGVAGTFALFQAIMPMLGWICIHTIVEKFKAFEKLIPWIALILLCYIGGKMLYDSLKHKDCECEEKPKVGFVGLIVQGIATSIDALSVGFTIAHYDIMMAILAASIIAVVTFINCFAGILIGKTVGMKFAGKAGIFGGAILIFIGLEIFITSFL